MAYDAVPNKLPVNDVAQTFPLTVKDADVGLIVPIPILLLLPEMVPPPLPNLIVATVES